MRLWIILKETVLLWAVNLPIRSSKVDRNRWRLLRFLGVKIENCTICPPICIATYNGFNRLTIGGGTYINTGFRTGFVEPSTITVGSLCNIGPNVNLETGYHDLMWSSETKWGGGGKSIEIKDKCWLGMNVTVLGGVTIGEGAVIAAGAVVTKDVEPYTLMAGVPAKKIRSLK